MKSLAIELDGFHGSPTAAIWQSNYINALSLGIDTEETSTVPAKAKIILFSSTGNFYLKVGATAAVPGDVTDGSASELNPASRRVAPGDILHLISPAACVVTMAYYS